MSDSLLVKGKIKICGETMVQGSKNTALPLIAACIAMGGKRILENIPKITDVIDLLEIFSCFGVKYLFVGNRLEIDSTFLSEPNIENEKIISERSKKIRSSMYLIGALLVRAKYIKLPKPGGCPLGVRALDIHFGAIESIGGMVVERDDYYELFLEKIECQNIIFRYPSFGATINAILLSCFNDRTIMIENTALEPEIDSVIEYLNKSGRNIERKGKNILVRPSELSRNVTYFNKSDRIVVGDLLLSTVATGGEIVINGVNSVDNKALIRKLTKKSCNLYIKNDKIIYNPKECLVGYINTQPFPGFATDLQAQFGCSAVASGGYAVINETVFDSRYKYAHELSKLGAKVRIIGNKLIIAKSSLHSSEIDIPDLRGGAGLVIVAMSINGYTKINNLHIIERGYEDIIKMYNSLGGELLRTDER